MNIEKAKVGRYENLNPQWCGLQIQIKEQMNFKDNLVDVYDGNH